MKRKLKLTELTVQSFVTGSNWLRGGVFPPPDMGATQFCADPPPQDASDECPTVTDFSKPCWPDHGETETFC